MDNKFLIQASNGAMRPRCVLIQKRIDNLGLTFEQAGQLCGLPGNTMKRAAAARNITIDTLLRISNGLDIKPEKLLKEISSVRRAVEKGRPMKRADFSGSGVGQST